MKVYEELQKNEKNFLKALKEGNLKYIDEFFKAFPKGHLQ